MANCAMGVKACAVNFRFFPSFTWVCEAQQLIILKLGEALMKELVIKVLDLINMNFMSSEHVKVD